MNKDFADLSRHVSLSITEYHGASWARKYWLFSTRRTLHDTPWMQVLPTKVPTLEVLDGRGEGYSKLGLTYNMHHNGYKG